MIEVLYNICTGVEPAGSCAFWDKPSGMAEFKFDRTLWRVFIIFPIGERNVP